MIPNIKRPSIHVALIPIFILIGMLFFNIRNYGDDSIGGPNQIALLLAGAIAVVIAISLGHKWKDIRKQIIKAISEAMPSILILLLIGALAGTWMISGVVPTLVYYGLEILNPKIFLFVAVIISSVVAISTGSSWSTIATIGVALFGIGSAMGFHEGMVAGAIISGAYFGDKLSPLSDTTNLAPAMAGTDLFTHIRYMTYTTVPTISITLIIFLILGFTVEPRVVDGSIDEFLGAIDSTFNISPFLLIVPIVLIVIIVKKTPPLPAIFIGILLGAAFAVVFQHDLLVEIVQGEDNYLEAVFVSVMNSMYGSVQIPTDNSQVGELLSTGGMASMLDTVWLILTAMVFSGIMESAGLLHRISEGVMNFAKSTGSLVASTVFTSFFINFTASEQYISIVIPGRMFKDAYKEKGLKPEVLSRTLEDGGTVTSVLIPWNTCGAVQSSVLGVPTLVYAPFVFFSLISPFMTIFFAYFNIAIRRISAADELEEEPNI